MYITLHSSGTLILQMQHGLENSVRFFGKTSENVQHLALLTDRLYCNGIRDQLHFQIGSLLRVYRTIKVGKMNDQCKVATFYKDQ